MARNPLVAGEKFLATFFFSSGLLAGLLAAVLANWITDYLKVRKFWVK